MRRRKKEPERQTAGFGEHFRFFSVPFFTVMLLFPLVFTGLNWQLGIFRMQGKLPIGIEIIPPAIGSCLLWLGFFDKRTNLLHPDGAGPFYRKPSGFFAFFGPWGMTTLTNLLAKKYTEQGYIESDLPGFSHPVTSFNIDIPCWTAVFFLGCNLLFLLTTAIPVMYRKDLYQYLGKEIPLTRNGKH